MVGASKRTALKRAAMVTSHLTAAHQVGSLLQDIEDSPAATASRDHFESFSRPSCGFDQLHVGVVGNLDEAAILELAKQGVHTFLESKGYSHERAARAAKKAEELDYARPLLYAAGEEPYVEYSIEDAEFFISCDLQPHHDLEVGLAVTEIAGDNIVIDVGIFQLNEHHPSVAGSVTLQFMDIWHQQSTASVGYSGWGPENLKR